MKPDRKKTSSLPALLRGIDSGAEGGATVTSPPVTVAPGLGAGLALALLKSAANLSVRPAVRLGSIGSSRASRSGGVIAPAIPAPVISTPSPAEGTDGQASYQLQMQASGPALTWSISAGSLPAGLSINAATGLISGSPTAEETANFTVRAANAAGADTEAVEITINAAPEITTTTLTAGTEGEAYTTTLVATGGTGDGTWAVQSGALPDGLSLNAGTGEITGTPTTVETANFTVRYTDENGVYDDQALELEIESALVDPDSFTGLRGNFGFASGDISYEVSPPTQVAGVSGNLGTGEIGTAGAITWNANGTGITWAADPVGNGRPGCSFNEASSLRTGNTSPAEVITNTEFWIAVVAQVDTGGVNTNSGTSYSNDAIFNDALSYFGLFLQSDEDALGLNWDGNEDVAQVTDGFDFDVPHLFVLRHLAGKIGVSIDGGAFTEVDSNNTQALNSTYLELFKSLAGTVQRVMIHDSVPANAADIVASLRGWYQTA